jgi:hypothetical protein
MRRVWELDYIEDAATRREAIRFRDGRICDPCASNYDPPWTGVHLCGQTDDGIQPTTVAAYAMRAAEVGRLFVAAKSAAECVKGEHDFIVDLCIGGDIIEDFYSNRQLWPRAIDAWNAGA